MVRVEKGSTRRREVCVDVAASNGESPNQTSAGKAVIVAYTAVFSGYDRLSRVQSTEDVEYVAFTDKPQPATGWTWLTPPGTEPDPRRENRKHKTRSHQWFPTSDWTIYLDANLRLKVAPQQIVDACLSTGSDAPLFLCRHDARDCVYKEAEICIRLKLDDPAVIRSQVDRYRAVDYPTHNGLYWGGLLIRRAGCEAFNTLWWAEVKRGSCRDQISLPWALSQSGIKFHVLDCGVPFSGGVNPFVARVRHSPAS